MKSLASQYLQEIEDLAGPERQKQEETIKVTLGSIFGGDVSYLWTACVALTTILLSRCRYCTYFLNNVVSFLLTPTIETVSSMSSLILALVLFPGVHRRAQEKLDAVVGRDRLPTLDDRPRLPYIEAICKEVMRWKMVTPMGLRFPM